MIAEDEVACLKVAPRVLDEETLSDAVGIDARPKINGLRRVPGRRQGVSQRSLIIPGDGVGTGTISRYDGRWLLYTIHKDIPKKAQGWCFPERSKTWHEA